MPFPFPQPEPLAAALTESAATLAPPGWDRWELHVRRGMAGRAKRMTLTREAIGEGATARIVGLMDAAGFTRLPAQLGAPTYDGQEYRLVAGDGTTEHGVMWTNRTATPELMRLFRTLEILGTWVPEG